MTNHVETERPEVGSSLSGELPNFNDDANTLVNLVPNAMFIVDDKGTICSTNRKANMLFGYEPGELIGLPIEVVVPEKNRKVHVGDRQNYMAAPQQRVLGNGRQLAAVRKNGKQFYVTVDLTPIRVRGLRYVSAIVRDDTEYLNAIDKLEKSVLELDRFSQIAAHDLQEPIRMMGRYSLLLSRRYRGKLDADADEFFGYIVEGAERMKTLIRDLRTYSLIRYEPNSHVPVDLNQAVDVALSKLDIQIEETGAIFERTHLPMIIGSPSQMSDVMEQLIGNALKFRSESAPIVRISHHIEPGEAIISITDNGIGIEERYWQHVFGLFQRLNPRESYPGSGIGLTIAQKIVDGHTGRIWISPNQGMGTTLSFSLALAPDDA